MEIGQQQAAKSKMQFSIGEVVLCLPIFAASLLVWWRLPGNATFFLAVVQALVFWLCWKLLCQNIPRRLLEASHLNSFRRDGRRSSRRARLERKAQAKLRRDILAALVIACLIGNFGALAIYLGWRMQLPIETFDRVLLLAAAIGLLAVGTWQATRVAVGMALADFEKGLRRRRQEFIVRDIGSLQAEYFHDQSPSV